MARWLVVVILVACGGGDGDGGGNKDAAPTGDSSPMQDGATTDAPTTFSPGALCGTMTCPTNQGCCIGTNMTCRAANDCPSQHFACDGPEDCSGGSCCFGSGGQGGSECRTQSCGEVACHFDTDCGASTPKCCPRAFTPSYKVCLAACP